MDKTDKPKSARDVLIKVYNQETDSTEEVQDCIAQALTDIYSLLGEIKTENFESFLRDKHAEQYIGTKDCMIDDFNHWAEYLGTDELIEYGNKFAGKIDAAWRKHLQERLR